MTVWLVCGGRWFADRTYVFGMLDSIAADEGLPTRVIHGAARGVDSMAAEWAAMRGIPTTAYQADWLRDGRKAGPLRNQRMLDHGKPSLVVAFNGGRGTADMVRRATQRRIRTLEFARG